jgi:prepilin-type N-terminal cleavage/methylation domain-containing protein
MKNNHGFTFVELIIASAISAIVLLGAYVMFDSIITSREVSIKSDESVTLNARFSSLLAADFRQAVDGTAEVRSLEDRPSLYMITHNSLYFQGAIPVKVQYYIEDGYLIREEIMPMMDYESKMRILPLADNLTVLFYDAGEYHERTVNGSRMIKLKLTANGVPIEALAGNYHKNTLYNLAGMN